MRTLRVVACLLFVALAAFAQSDRGSITGTILDPAGAVVPNAKIEAKNMDSGSVYEAVSSGTGNFTIPQLPSGNYELTVTVQGFKKYIRQNLTVTVATATRQD